MGIYDRDYYRNERSGVAVNGPQTIVGWIILINVIVFFADGLYTPEKPVEVGRLHPATGRVEVVEIVQKTNPVSETLAVHVGDLTKPWYWWRFLTYGFTHASWPEYGHILGNMLGLFFLGRFIEQLYGRKEFLRLYLTLIVFSGVVWALASRLQGVQLGQPAVGASGAVVGIVILFALNFPHQTVLLFFVLPIPAWVLGMLVVLLDLRVALSPESSHIAYQAHMAGAAFAFFYYRGRWNLTRLYGRWFSPDRLKPRPKLQVHRPKEEPAKKPANDLSEEVDRILEKIHREGEDSLTAKERKTLENASRQYQRKNRFEK